jgi:Xaa-Pro aminopeptidase
MPEIRKPKRFELPFPMSEYKDRLRRVREAMQLAGVDVKVVTNQQDLYWLTGTRVVMEQGPGDNQLIIWDGDPIMIVRHLESSSHKYSAWVKDWVDYFDEGPINPYDPMKKVAEFLKEHGIDKKKIGMNFRLMTLQNYSRLKKLLPDAEICDFRVERLRIIKSKLEQECQFKAAKINQDSFMNTINDMEIGWSQRDIEQSIARYHEKYLGSNYERSEVLCMVGADAMHMHANIFSGEASAAKIKKGDVIYIEPGTFVKRYVGCLIRMVAFGEPPPAVRKSCEASIEALNRAIDATAPGKTSHEVDKAARDYFVKNGFDCQGRLGYACGIDWSQANVMSIEPNNPLIMVPGHIFHYISINYLPGWGYMGASEQVLVTEDGHKVLADRDRTCERKLFVK